MKIIVIGSGLIGVTSAYLLARHGHEVTVVDRQEGPGRETSFANGALITPSMAEPWNAPESWRVLLASLARSDAALQLRWLALPTLMSWGLAFLRNSSPAIVELNTKSNLRLAVYSLAVMESLRQQTGIDYGRSASGSLRIFRKPADLDQACVVASRRASESLCFRRLTREETVELEPALAPIADRLAGGLHYQTDETGDAYRFCVALAECAQQQGVTFRFRAAVSSLEVRGGRVTAAMCGQERLVADRYVVAAGSYSAPLLQRLGIRLPVRPVKGYSVTFDNGSSESLLRVPVIDDSLHAGVVPINGSIRVVGTAEFAGYDLTLPPARIRCLTELLHEVLPRAQFEPASGKPWCGLRPMSADGVPIIGATAVENLLVNTGHGHLGWTLAAGSAQMLADLISGEPPSLDPAPFALARFTADHRSR